MPLNAFIRNVLLKIHRLLPVEPGLCVLQPFTRFKIDLAAATPERSVGSKP